MPVSDEEREAVTCGRQPGDGVQQAQKMRLELART